MKMEMKIKLKKMKSINNAGFTLVEIMIATAALGGLALVGMQLTKNQTKSSTKANLDSETILITNEIVAILSDPTKCLTTLGGKNALSTPTGINSINGNKYFTLSSGSAPTQGYGNANVNITSYALSASAAEVTAKNSKLLINFENKNILKGASGPSTITKKINLFVEVDGASNITACRSLSSSSSDIWSRGSAGDIFYSGGKVGIGTPNPVSQLDVQGGIRPGDQTQVLVCDAATEGTQRYNKVAHAMEYCGASGSPLVYAWTPMGGSLSGYQIVTNSITSGGHYDVDVYCPVGKKVLGGGCNQQSGANRGLVDANPISSSGWHCRVRDISNPQSVTTTAYAICVD